MTTQHTPTPWRAMSPASASGWFVIADAGGYEIGSGDGGLEKADAEFIVRACNAHDELVAALQNIAEAVEYGIAHADVRAECGEIARAALAKVA